MQPGRAISPRFIEVAGQGARIPFQVPSHLSERRPPMTAVWLSGALKAFRPPARRVVAEEGHYGPELGCHRPGFVFLPETDLDDFGAELGLRKLKRPERLIRPEAM